MLGVLDPASSERKFFVVLEVFVAGAIGTDETTVLGVTCMSRSAIRPLLDRDVRRSLPMYCKREAGVVSQELPSQRS